MFGDRAMAALVTFVAALIYVGLGQTTLHHNDGHRILELLQTGEMDFGRHHLSVPVMHAFHRWIGEPLGMLPHRSVTMLNGINSALAVGLVFLSSRVAQLTRRQALVAATLFGGCFPVLFFATLVEFHGVFLPSVTFAFWLACVWMRRGGYRWALAMGAVAGIATQLHSMGIFASGLFSLCHWAARPDRAVWRKLTESLAAVAAHAALFIAGTALWQSLGWSVGSALDALDALPRGMELVKALAELMPKTAWREFLLPFTPLSLITLWALTKRPGRAAAAALLLGSLPYIALSALILGVSEHGAYLATLTAPMALLAARMLPLRTLTLIALGTLAFNAAFAWRHDSEGERYKSFIAGLKQVGGEDRCLLLYCEDPVPGPDTFVDELAAVRVFAPTTASIRLEEFAAAPKSQVQGQVEAMTKAMPSIYLGVRLLMGEASRECLRDDYQSGPLMLTALEQVYRFVPRKRLGFEGFELIAR